MPSVAHSETAFPLTFRIKIPSCTRRMPVELQIYCYILIGTLIRLVRFPLYTIIVFYGKNISQTFIWYQMLNRFFFLFCWYCCLYRQLCDDELLICTGHAVTVSMGQDFGYCSKGTKSSSDKI